MTLETPRKVLILRPRFLGDLILATGLAGVMRKNNPGTEVWYLAETPYAEILGNHPEIAGVLPLEPGKKNNPFYIGGFYRKIRRQRFEAVLDLFGNFRTALVSFFSGAPLRVGFEMRGRSWAYTSVAGPATKPLPSGRRPVTDAYLDQVRALGFSPVESYKTSLFTTKEEKAHAKTILNRALLRPGQKVAALFSGATWSTKRWPLERFVELGRRLAKKGARPLFLFGPKDAELARSFEVQMEPGWIFVNQPSLRGLTALIEASDLLISNDAGPMHIGPAVGTPTLGIFGPGEPEIWFPYQAPHAYAHAEVDCSHCGREQCSLMVCMDRLEVDFIAGKAISLLGSQRRVK